MATAVHADRHAGLAGPLIAIREAMQGLAPAKSTMFVWRAASRNARDLSAKAVEVQQAWNRKAERNIDAKDLSEIANECAEAAVELRKLTRAYVPWYVQPARRRLLALADEFEDLSESIALSASAQLREVIQQRLAECAGDEQPDGTDWRRALAKL